MNLQGSVFVEFEDMKTVEAFLNADPKPSWDGTELLIMSKCEISPLMASLL
jgi:lupus La protein